jgi:hypothetical protein
MNHPLQSLIAGIFPISFKSIYKSVKVRPGFIFMEEEVKSLTKVDVQEQGGGLP